MRPAKGGKEVIESVLVGDIDGRELEADLVPVAAEEVVVANGYVEEVPGWDAGWVVVVVLRSCGWDTNQARRELRRRTGIGQSHGWSCPYSVAGESCLELLVGGQAAASQIDWIRAVAEWHSTSHQPAVIAPVEAHPGTAFPGLVLEVRGHVEFL